MGSQLPLPKGAQPTSFRPMSIVAKWWPISVTAEHLLYESLSYFDVVYFLSTSLCTLMIELFSSTFELTCDDSDNECCVLIAFSQAHVSKLEPK